MEEKEKNVERKEYRFFDLKIYLLPMFLDAPRFPYDPIQFPAQVRSEPKSCPIPKSSITKSHSRQGIYERLIQIV